jgi:G3E family GTPase
MNRVPVTVVTGALGAGKTTLVNHLIAASGRRLAVIVNEFGEVGIDGELIASGVEELVELNSGCVCCVVRGDLIRTLRGLLDGRDFDAVVIETTGLANPGPVIQTFFADQQLAARCRLDAVVTVVDAVHFEAQLAASHDVADQVALASVVFLNKCANAPDIDAVEVQVRGLNPLAAVHRTERGRVDPGLVFETRGFDLDAVGGLSALEHEVHAHGEAEVRAVCLSLNAPVDAEALQGWLESLLNVHGGEILRTKGIFHVAGEDRRLVVQAVHMLVEGDFAGRWPGGPRHSRVVFIGRGLEALDLEAGLRSCVAHVMA